MPDSFLLATLFPGLLSGLLICLWPRQWANEVCYPEPSESQYQLRRAWVVLVITFALTLLLVFVTPNGYSDAKQRSHGFADVMRQVLVWGIVLLPMYLVAQADGFRWRDFQYQRSNTLSSLVLGNLVGMMFLVGAGKFTRLPLLFTLSGFLAGLQYSIVGFAEETLFRGYLQVRWIAVTGGGMGILWASVVMSLFHKETPSPEQQGSVSGVKSAGHTRGQKPNGCIIISLLTFFTVVCIVITSLNNLLDTPLLAFGPKYDAATYGITDTAKAVLVIENHSVFYIDSIELTRHQDRQVYELDGVTLEGVGVFPIEPGGYDLAVHYRDSGKDPIFYVDSSATAHFNIRRKRAVIFHLEGGATGGGLLSYIPPDLIGK